MGHSECAEIQSVGFIGLGIMGQSMASHLIGAGYSLNIFNRTKSKADGLISHGAKWCDTIAEVAKSSDVIITMVGYPIDVRQVYLGADGVIENARSGSLLIDMTTSNPSLAKLIAESASVKGLMALDAPVSGGDVGAKDGTLAIMVGGEQVAFDRAMPLFEAMGKTIKRLGRAGAGQHTKMVNQTVIASTIMGVAEGMAYAKRSGLDPKAVLEVIGAGAAGGAQLNGLGPRMIAGDFDPGFFVHHFLKDMGIALDEAEAMGVDLPALTLSRSRFEELSALGYGSDGTQALLRLYDDGYEGE